MPAPLHDTLSALAQARAHGIKVLGVIDILIVGAEHVGLPAFAMAIVFALVTLAAAIIMGSGNAPFLAFVELIPQIAASMGVNTAAMILPMQQASHMGRAMSPVSGVIIAVSSGAKLTRPEELRLELMEKINALGVGAQGLGGLTTVLDVKVLDYPCHAANLPVALVPNCAATRHCHFHLDGSGPAKIEPPKLEDWPAVTWTPDLKSATRVNLDTLTKEEVAAWKPGQKLLLNGKMLTGRDAAHKRIADMLAKGEKLPVDFTNRVIYYVGPVDPVGDEVVGPAGPTTATRMDKFTRMMLEQTGLIAMVGKSERGSTAIAAIKDNKSAYLMAVGGAAYLVAKAIKGAKVVGFADLGMEAIYEFDLQDMPVTVAVDSEGTSVHETGPIEWCTKIGKIPVQTLFANKH